MQKQWRNYIVTISSKLDPRSDCTANQYATSAAHAIKRARADVADSGHTRHDGALTYRARLDKESNRA